MLVAGSVQSSGCSRNPEQSQTNKQQANANSAAASKPKTTATGTISASTNPIKVCDGSGTVISTLSWTSVGTTYVEVRIGEPDGALFARSGPTGSSKTGKWVRNGMVFHLQDVSGGKPLAPENTIASVTATVTNEGCP
jgi:hypothetical protein